MKSKFIKTISLAALVGFGFTSCEDFLNRPTEDNYVADGYYKTDDQCLAGTSYLYSSPWSDFTRNFIKVGEVLSGNFYPGSGNAYMDFTLNSSDAGLTEMSASLWSVIAHCNTVYNYIKKSSGPSDAAKGQTLGECLTWKATAYFFLVRSFGEIPIVHDNSASLESGDYTTVSKVQRSDVYDYIIVTLEEAIKQLPETPMQAGRIDRAAAQGLLAKVYLTKAGITGEINKEDLNKAIEYAKACIADKNHSLMSNYEDVFKLKNNINSETLIAWRWNAKNNQWTDQSFMQSDYGIEGFSEFGDLWGGWQGMSTDLQEDFGVKMLESTPDVWLNNRDKRLHATMMLPGFKYDQFWQDKGGFDFLKFSYDVAYNPSAHMDDTKGRYTIESPTGAPSVKHLWGNGNDHLIGAGHAAGRMASSLATPILRLSDVYLVLAEANLILGNPSSPQSAVSTSSEVLTPFNTVHKRAGLTAVTSVSWNDIWKERRLELAFEGDRWYDFVRVSYYNPEYSIKQLCSQKRNVIWGLDDMYYNYYKSGEKDWVVTDGAAYDTNTPALGESNVKGLMKTAPESGKLYFAIPMTAKDIEINPNLAPTASAVSVNVREAYRY